MVTRKNYGIKDFRITNCIVQLNNEGSYSVIDFNGGGWIKDLQELKIVHFII